MPSVPVTIASRQNPLVKQVRKLHRAKGRREQNLFLLEGTHLLMTACEANCSLETACYTAPWREEHPQLWEKLKQRAKRLEMVTPEVLECLATTCHPDGAIATARRERQLPQWEGLQLGLVLERLQDPGNLGTIVRAAAATGVDGLWLSRDSADIDSPKVLRASAGAWFRLPIAVPADLEATVKQSRERGIQIVATSPQGNKTYWEVNFRRPTLILLGNEGAGLSPELLALADERAVIPLEPGVESLNVAIAAALLLYEAQRQRRS